MGSNHPLVGRKKPFLPTITLQSIHRPQRAEYTRLLSGMDLVEVVDLTEFNGVDSPKTKQQPADGNMAGVEDKNVGAEKRGGDDVRPVQDADAEKEWDDSLLHPDLNAPETSHIDRSGTERNVSVLSPTVVGDSRENLICADDRPRDEGAGTGANRLDYQLHPLDATASEQDHLLRDAAYQAGSDNSTREPQPNPDTTTTHATPVNSSGRTTDDQPLVPGSTSSGDEDMHKQRQPSLPVTGSTEHSPEGPANGTPEYGTDAFGPELTRLSPTDLGLLDSTSKPTNPLDFFLPGSPTDAATEGFSPVDSSQGEGHSATQDVNAVGENSQPVQPQSPHQQKVISSPKEHFTVACSSSKVEHPTTTSPPTSNSPSKASPLTKDDSQMDYVNRLSQEQRDQYAPLGDGHTPTIPARPRRDRHQGHGQPGARGRKRKADSRIPTSGKPAKRHRSSTKATVLPSLAGSTLATSSQGRARGNTPAIRGDDGPPPVDAKQNRYAVEHLLDRRIRHLRGRNQQVVQYLIRWEGYGPNDDEWVNEGDIDKGLIQAYASTKSA